MRNIHKSVIKRKQEIFQSNSQNVIIEASISQENDFLISPATATAKDLIVTPELNSQDAESAVLKVPKKSESNESPETADDEDKLEEEIDSYYLKTQIQKLEMHDRLFTAEKLNEMAVLSALKREKKRFCTHCQKFKVIIPCH